MKKLFLAITVSIFIVFIGLARSTPLQNSFFTSPSNNDSAKPVVFHYYRPNTNFINGLVHSAYVAHRGAPMVSNEPENSLSSFKNSKKLGFKLVETDLRLTKDEQWVIIHDYILDRTTTGTGTVQSHYLNDIKKLKLKENRDESLSVPTLDDFLKLCQKESLIPILDIKPTETEISPKAYDSLLLTLNKYNLLDKSIFCSHSKEVLSELRSRDDLTAIAAMIDVSQDNLNFVNKLNNAFMYCNYTNLTDDKIDLIHKNNLGFGVWTINDEKTAEYFLAKGALVIVTDKLRN